MSSPPIKKVKTESPDAPTDDILASAPLGPSSGIIRFEMNVYDITPTGISSPVIEVLGMPWKLVAKKGANPSSLAVDLSVCHKPGADFRSVDACTEFSLLNLRGNGGPLVKESTTRISKTAPSVGINPVILLEDLCNEEKGFMKNGKIVVVALFTLSNMIVVRANRRIDCTNANDPRHDVALVLNGGRIYTNKTVLSMHSPIFDALFFGDYVAKNKKEFELKDIDSKEFIVLHNVLHSFERISDANAEILLKLADRFEIRMITDKVAQFLLDSSQLSMPIKLLLSDQYGLYMNRVRFLATFKTVKNIEDLMVTEQYKSLSVDTKYDVSTKKEELIRAANRKSKH